VLNPIEWIREAGRKIAAPFQYAPALKRYSTSDAAVMADDYLAANRSIVAAGAETAAERARAVQYQHTPAENAAMRRYLVAKDLAATVRSGTQTLPAGKSYAQVLQDVRDAAARIEPAKLARFEREYRQWADEVWDRLVRSGQVDPAWKREDYVPHLVKAYYEEFAGPPAFRGVVESRPGMTRQRQGSELPIEEDPYGALAFADYVSRKAGKDAELAGEMRRYAVTADVQSGTVAFDPAEHALYSFGPGRARILKGREARKVLEASGAAGPAEPLVSGNTTYEVLPRDLAEGLFAAGGEFERTGLGKVLQAAGRWNRNVQLIANPAFHAAQAISDPATAYMNIPVHRWPQFAKAHAAASKRLLQAYAERAAGGAPRYLDEMRQKGYITEVFETLLDRADPTHVISQRRTTPGHIALPGAAGGAWRVVRAIPRAVKTAGEFRETSLKIALGEVYESMGASPQRAAQWANRVMGNYQKSGKWGRLAGTHVQFAKWFVEQGLRLTVDIARDPVTGRHSLRGLASGPAPKIAGGLLLIQAINNRNPEVAEVAKNLPSEQRGAIVLGKRADGGYNLWRPDTLISLVGSAYDALREGAKWGPGQVASDLGEWAAQRANPVLKAGYMGLTGKEPGGGPLYSRQEEGGLTTAQRKALNVKRGGWASLTPSGQKWSEMVTGAPGRLIRQLRSEDTSTRDLQLLRPFGLQVYRADKTGGVAEEKGRHFYDWQQRWLDARETGDAKGEKESREMLIRFGFRLHEFKRLLKEGAKHAAEFEQLTSEERKARRRRRLMPFLVGEGEGADD